MCSSSGSALISASTSRPSSRGRLRSSRIRSGRGASAYLPPRAAGTPAPPRRRSPRAACWRSCVLERFPGHQDVARVVLDEQDSIVALGRFHVLGFRSPGRAGRVKQKLVAGRDRACRARSRPPWYSTIFLQIARPMPVPGYVVAGVQPLEDHEDPSAYSVRSRCRCRDTEQPLLVLPGARDTATRARSRPAELHRVADQVLEHCGEQRRRPAPSAASPRLHWRSGSSIAAAEVRQRRSARWRRRAVRSARAAGRPGAYASRSLISCCMRLRAVDGEARCTGWPRRRAGPCSAAAAAG